MNVSRAHPIRIALMAICVALGTEGQMGEPPLPAAWSLLADGDPVEAERIFREQLLHCERACMNAKPVAYVESERGLFLAEFFEKHDPEAGKMLRRISSEYGADMRAGRLVLQGRWSDGLQAFGDSTADNSIVDPHPEQADPIVRAGVKLALGGDIRAAIREWARAPDGGGPDDLGSLQRALIGMGYAHLGSWPSAEEYLLAAARYRRAIPGDDLDPGNLTALYMLDAYRAHFARGEHRYSWPTLPR